MSAENPGDFDLDAEILGPLASIPADSLIRLATETQNGALNTRALSGRLVARVGGSYNIAHITRLDNWPLGISSW